MKYGLVIAILALNTPGHPQILTHGDSAVTRPAADEPPPESFRPLFGGTKPSRSEMRGSYRADPNRLRPRITMDTIRSIAINGEDTTTTITISPSLNGPKQSIESIAGSLRFMAVLSGIGFALSAASFIVILND